jgi:peptidoglycan/LPS O-acetylase OafA/YrhL
MLTNKMPRLAFQHHSQLGEDHWHSVLISLLRGLAAVQVAAAHLRAATYPSVRAVEEPSVWFLGLAFATGFAHQAVLVFFIISGWLVGGSLLNKIGQPGAIAGYAIDRMTRLWTVLVPTFLLTLLFGLGTGVVSADGIDYSAVNEYSALAFAGNLVGLQHVVLPEFGANFPLWSLANETWYYVLFPLLVVLFTSRRSMPRLACGAALVLLATSLPYAMVLYFSVWLLGVAVSRIRIDCGIATRLGLLLLLGVVSVYFRLKGDNDDFVAGTFWQDLACSLAFVAFLASLQFRAAPGSKLLRPVAGVGKFFAEFSFSLYVLHVPLIGLLVHLGTARFGLRQLSPGAPQHFAIYFGMLAIVLAASYLSYRLFEAQTYRLRRLIKGLLLERAAPAAAAPALRAD